MKKFLLLIAVALSASFFAGCHSTYSEKKLSDQPPPLLRNDSRIYVAIPFDASYKHAVAQNSGKQTADALVRAFNRNTKAVFSSKYPESLSEALESGRKRGAEFLVYPVLLKWEDHSTELSGVRDKLQLRIDMIALDSSTVVYSQMVEATGKWMGDGGDTPGDLLQQPCDNYVNSLFRHIETPSALR